MASAAPPGDHRLRPDEATVRAALFPGDDLTAQRLRQVDWAATALGPVRDWPPAMTQAVRTVLPSRIPMLLWLGPELRQVYNEAYAHLAGEKHPAAIGQRADECWYEIWDDVAPLVDAARRGEDTYARNLLLMMERHGYREETYWTFSYSAVRDETGDVIGVFVATTDATAVVVGERRLDVLRRLGEELSATDQDPSEVLVGVLSVLISDREDVPFAAAYEWDETHTSLALRAAHGLPPDHPLPSRVRAGDPLWGLLAGTGPRRERDLGERWGMRVSPGELSETVPDEAVVTPVLDRGSGRVAAVLVLGLSPHRIFDDEYSLFVDLVARQVSVALSDSVAVATARQRAEALAELDRAKTRFLENISHELRTPLTLVAGPLEDLLHDPAVHLTADHRASMEAAAASARRLRHLIDSLLLVAGTEGASPVHPEPTDVAWLVREVAGMFRAAVEAGGVTLVTDLPASSLVVDVDRDRFADLLVNLLSNATKFTTAGTITVRLLDHGDETVLVVEDTGAGIEQASLDRIFERFYRAPQAEIEERVGTGIGLAMVAEIAAAHGGGVEVASTPGVGSTFTVTLPSARRHPVEQPTDTSADVLHARVAAAVQVAVSAPAASTVRSDAARDPAEEGPTVLVVEDDVDLLAYLVRLLHRDGWRTVTATSVPAALAQSTVPDVILSDVMLPGPSGIDLVRIVRSDPVLASLPVILLTARAGAQSAVEGLAAGATDYVTKPFDSRELLARVRVHHERHRQGAQALDRSEERAEHLHLALDTSRAIGAAIGILMARHTVTYDEALDRLRRASQERNRKLRDLAEEVTRTGTLD